MPGRICENRSMDRAWYAPSRVRNQGMRCLIPVAALCTFLVGGQPLAGQAFAAQVPAEQLSPQQQTAVHPRVEVIQMAAPDKSALVSRKGSYSFSVSGSDWIDTGVTVTTGDHLNFTATGSLTLADGRTATPDGLQRGWRDLVRIFPLNSANSGELIGRIGNADFAVPFAIGASKDVDVVATGHLFLRTNLSTDLTSSGSFEVKMKLTKGTAHRDEAAPDMAKLVSPELFANIPRRVQDQQGNPGDMVNFALIGSEDQVKAAFTAAGWVAVDSTTQQAVLHGLIATLSHDAYTEMPMSTLFLFGRPQDLSFARATPIAVAAIRHHLRVWKTTETVGGQPLWVGSATHDNGFERDERNGGVTHHIDPNIDQERDFLEQSFTGAGALEGAAYVLPSNPLTSARTATGGTFSSDGRIVVMALR
jgi:LssY C-terminus